MNTLHLKYAIEVERTRSITQAAENLFMGQPNLSKAIKELEDNVGYAIFRRTSKGVVPTEKGAEFLNYAQNILIQIDKMNNLADGNHGNTQSLSVSIPRGSYIASAFTSFVEELDMHKGINLNIQETNSMQAINNIVNGPFNMGVIRYQTDYEYYFQAYLDDKQLKYEAIWEFEYLALMSELHPLAQKDRLEAIDLKEYTQITHGDTLIPYLSQNSGKVSEVDKKTIFVYERCNQFDLLSSIPMTYMWVSPIPDKWLKRYNLVQRKCKADHHVFKDILVYQKHYKLTELDKKFIDKIFESKNELAFNEYR